MLKYTINRSRLNADRKSVTLYKVSMVEMPTDSNDKNLLICYYAVDEEYNFTEGQTISINYRLDISNDNDISTRSLNFAVECELLRVNSEKGVFATVVDRYYDLSISSLTEIEEDGNTKWHFYFPDGHLFDRLPYEDDDIERLPIVLYIEYPYTEDGALLNGLAEIECEYVSPNELRCDYTDELQYLRGSIFSDNGDTATLSGIRVYRQTPLFRQSNNIFIYIDSTLCNISIPLSLNFATNMYQSDAINENFVADEKNKAINRIVDMEKDVYHPVIWNSSKTDENGYRSGNYVDGIDKEADKIVFNLHFRQHRGDDWLVEPDVYWNGCYIDPKNKIRLLNDYEFAVITEGEDGKEETKIENENINFFSYKDKSKQSDLLTYLNFTNDDVRYQKNKLARSFIRIMFYDSMNPANQNLLYYSTIFLDSGTLFGKYIKHIEETPYRSVIYETDETTGEETINVEESSKDLVGIRVNREPCGDLVEDLKTDDETEELRLSCQLSVQDKYQSNGSSDGFYLYLWKDNEIGVAPVDIYMKVEFNHAGYGRTIPMMMPFWDPNKEYADGEKKGIKSFQEILEDWNSEKDEKGIWKYKENDDTPDEDAKITDGQYGARQYMKYSYIHFKCKYDKIHKQHIYYLDDDYYGDGVHFTDNIITLNLYEAKMV